MNILQFVLGTAFYAFEAVLFGGGLSIIGVLVTFFIDNISNQKWRLSEKYRENYNTVLCFCLAITTGMIMYSNEISMPKVEDDAYSEGYEEGYHEGYTQGEEYGIQHVLENPAEFDLFSFE